MARTDEHEVDLLRSAALQKAASILSARQVAEEALIEANLALEEKTKELAQSLATTRAALEAATDSEELFRASFDQAAVGMAIAGVDGRCEQANRRFCQILGYSAEELAEVTVRDLTHPDDLPQTLLEMKRLRNGEIADYSMEKRYIRKDGSLVWSLTTVALLRNPANESDRFIGVIEDITARKRTEEALQSREREFSLIFSNVSDVIFYLSVEADGRFRFKSVNPAFLTATGLSESGVVGKWTSEVIPEPSHSLALENYRTAVREKTTVRWEETTVYPSGTKVGAISVTPVLDTSGSCVSLIGTVHDMTERKRSEAVRLQLAAVVESSDDAILTKTLEGVISSWNKGAEQMFGYTAEETIGQSIMMLIPPSFRHEEPEILRKLKSGERIDHYETVRVRKDGRLIYVSVTVSPMKDSDGKIVGASKIARDITERKMTADALARTYKAEQQAREAAEQASSAKDHFIAALSHELRTPLTPALVILSDLRNDSTIPRALAEDLETVRRNVELEARLIDDLLDLTRITRGKLELHHTLVSVDQIIDDAIKTCRTDLDTKKLSLKSDLVQPPPIILADSARITQILWNLLKNAVKFTPEGGAITVRSRVAPRDGAECVVLEVEDTGIGIAPAQLSRVFDAFEQGDRKITRQFGGLGLGLAISKAIAESHGGSLAVTSDGLGKGCTFRLSLPITVQSGTDPALASDRLEETTVRGVVNTSQRSLRILLVEDHADTAAILIRVLGRMGHEIFHQRTVANALKFAEMENATTPLDLVMSDLGLPDESGLHLMRELSSKYRLPGIALSGYGMDSDVRQSIEAGFCRHLVKPIDIVVLRTAIAEVMREHENGS